jgi:putative ABC transport system ATP-binding protein
MILFSILDWQMHRLKAESVTLTYFDGDRNTNAVENVSLEIPARGFFGIMGPSGSGKSSLLYLLSGLKQPTAGEVYVDDSGIGGLTERQRAGVRRERFGFVFQQPFLLNYLTARENVLAAAPKGDLQAESRTQELLESLSISHLAESHPYQLSGGERQRVCVARAMINNPDVIFADEPTAALDHANGHMVMDLLTAYRDRGVVLVVTHDPEMLMGADRIIEMRDGRVLPPQP